MSKLLTFVLAAVLAASACDSDAAPTSPRSSGSTAPSHTAPGQAASPRVAETPEPRLEPTPVASSSPSSSPDASPGSDAMQILAVGTRDTSPAVSKADLRELIKGNTAFAMDLYAQLREGKAGNLVFSPYSISTAFGMLQAGAVGGTAAEIARTLHFTLPSDRLDAAFNELSLRLAKVGGEFFTAADANRLFGQQGLAFRQSFLEELTQQYGAPMAAVDFRNASESARQLINAWVAAQTNQRIVDLLTPGALSADTRFALVNALYLRAAWLSPFDTELTAKRPFVLAGGSSVRVTTLRDRDYRGVWLAVKPAYTAVELPFLANWDGADDAQPTMLIVMPRDIRAFEQTLDAASLAAIVRSLHSEAAFVSLPAFSVRTGTDLTRDLGQLGLSAAFSQADADFSGIAGDPGELFIQTVLHQAFVAVTANGVEAAASTLVGGGTGGGPEVIYNVNVDHPFVWFIRDRVNGCVLFMGRVMDPRS